jgi:aromatic ring hydroxylase
VLGEVVRVEPGRVETFDLHEALAIDLVEPLPGYRLDVIEHPESHEPHGISAGMRTGAEYRDALRRGRKVWVLGDGAIDDVTLHPATRAMVDEYVAWYDRHFDAAWGDVVMAPPDAQGERAAWGFVIPKSPSDLRAMGRCFSATTFLSAGNITHTPAYGHLIALGILDAVQQRNVSREQIAHAAAYRDMIARTGRFLTFAAGAATIGARLDADPTRRAALQLVREADRGLVIRGKIGMHTSPAYAEDVYVGSNNGIDYGGHRATFIVPVDAPGVTVVCRKISARHASAFVAPLSSRFDELDGQMWLDDVLVPWERIFLMDVSPEPMASWLFWHQLYCWLSKAEFTLGLALACADAMGLAEHEPTLEYVMDLVVDVQTVRTCQTAAELDPEITAEGYAIPGRGHIAAGSIAMLKARQRMAEILRILPGSSLVVSPTDKDLASPDVAAGLEESFGGGGYTALQRAALLQLASDHVASALDGRESAFELHANGGIPAWRGRLRQHFTRYNELANGVLGALNVDMPAIDVSKLRKAPLAPRRPVAPPPPKKL